MSGCTLIMALFKRLHEMSEGELNTHGLRVCSQDQRESPVVSRLGLTLVPPTPSPCQKCQRVPCHSSNCAGDGSVPVDVPHMALYLGLGFPGFQLLEGEPQGCRYRLCHGTTRQREPRHFLMTRHNMATWRDTACRDTRLIGHYRT